MQKEGVPQILHATINASIYVYELKFEQYLLDINMTNKFLQASLIGIVWILVFSISTATIK